jgi:hypothetical protein
MLQTCSFVYCKIVMRYHRLSGVHLKRIRKRTHAGCRFCDNMYLGEKPRPPKMTRTHVLLGCPALEDLRCEERIAIETGAFTSQSSIGGLLRGETPSQISCNIFFFCMCRSFLFHLDFCLFE